MRIIFDVGARNGVTAMQFSDAFPNARVFAFEPVDENFRKMQETLIGKPEIIRRQLALGAKRSRGHIRIDPIHSSTGSLIDAPTSSSQPIEIDTIDNVCEAEHIDQIDFIKIDVEGHELDVLAGAKKMLNSNGIGLIKLESAVDPDRQYHTPFVALCDFLFPFGFRLFGIYDQYEDWQDMATAPLRRFDAVFIGKSYLRRPG
jgi:FkbM family methyltransferase